MTALAHPGIHDILAAACAQAAAAPAAAPPNTFWMAAGIILLALGIVLGVLELFVPTGGLLALATATCLVGSIASFFAYSTVWGFAALALYTAGSPIALVLGLKLWTRTPIARSMVLGGVEADGELEGAPTRTPHDAPRADLQGAQGVAVTPMRPVGFVRIGAERIEAVAEMGMIEAGDAVEVVEASAARVVVRPRG